MIGILLVVLNLVVQFIPGMNWMAESDLLLHLGVLIALVGMMLAWAL